MKRRRGARGELGGASTTPDEDIARVLHGWRENVASSRARRMEHSQRH